MNTRIAFAAMCCILLTACQMITAPQEVDAGYQLDEPVALVLGETAMLDDPELGTTIETTFVRVTEDTRCPNPKTVAVMCAWSGAVEIELTAVVDGQSEVFWLAGITDYDGVVESSVESETDTTKWYFAGYDFALLRVTPYPGDERPQPEEYVSTAIVRRASGPVPTPTDVAASVEHLLDDAGMPALCVSDRAIVEWAAGSTTDDPLHLTPPLAEDAVQDIQTVNGACSVLFGEGWRIGTSGDVDGMWSQFVPPDAKFLLWDDDTEALIER